VPSISQPRRPRASPLWQILTAAWDAFLARYEKFHRPTLGPLRPNAFTAVCHEVPHRQFVLSTHEYVVDGAARFTEFTIGTTGAVVARFYYIEPIA